LRQRSTVTVAGDIDHEDILAYDLIEDAPVRMDIENSDAPVFAVASIDIRNLRWIEDSAELRVIQQLR